MRKSFTGKQMFEEALTQGNAKKMEKERSVLEEALSICRSTRKEGGSLSVATGPNPCM